MTDTELADRHGIGGNLPPDLAAELFNRHLVLIDRRNELLVAIGRVPTVIDDEETAGKMADFVVQLSEHVKAAKVIHHDEKAPFLADGRTVDSFLHSLVDEIEKGKATINVVRKKYADAKDAEERRIREEEEARLRLEQYRLQNEAAMKAQAVRDEQDLHAAIAAEEAAKQAKLDADKAAKAAAAKPAELGKSRGDYGGQTSLRQFWNHGEIDRAILDLHALRQHLPTDALERAVKSWINANKDGLKAKTASLSGVRIFEDTRL